MSMPFMPAGGAIAALRLLRLMRLVKIVNQVRKLRMLIEGLFAGMSQIGYISALMILIFYLFAVTGIFLFRENDPFHWYNMGRAMFTLFRYNGKTFSFLNGPMVFVF
jgi:voltage-gated sodium channel